MATIAAVTADGARCTLSDADIGSLRSALRGELIQSDHGSYEAARRVWNGNVDRRPALIARCTGVADVQQALSSARTSRVMVSVRGGGHGAPGYGTNDGGLVIDLSPMKGIHVDPGTGTARAQGGVLWRELDHETQAFGLATTGGTVCPAGGAMSEYGLYGTYDLRGGLMLGAEASPEQCPPAVAGNSAAHDAETCFLQAITVARGARRRDRWSCARQRAWVGCGRNRGKSRKRTRG
jgi:hypothetical protein